MLAWLSNYTQHFEADIITYPYPNITDHLANVLVKGAQAGYGRGYILTNIYEIQSKR